MTTSAYREKVETYIRGLVAENRVLQKLQEGEEISESEIRDLARLLEGQVLHVTEDRLRKVYDHKTARFIQFIRHILGLEKLESWSETITHAFDEFIAQHTTFSALQMRFLQTLKTFILQTGKVERENLIAQPFTNLHPQGIRGLFLPSQIQEIMTFVEEIGQQAA
jgi:type I restriction enzyme R subunit